MSGPADSHGELRAAADRLETRLGEIGRAQSVAHRSLLQVLLDLERVETSLGRGEFTPDTASLVLGVTEQRGHALLAEAHRLAELDRGLDLLEVLTVEQVRALLDAVDGLEPELADQVIDRVRERVTATGAGRGRRWVTDAARRARIRIAPKAEHKRRRRAGADRKVTVHPLPDGQAGLWVQGPQAAITRIQVAIRDRVADDGGDWFRWEDRTLDARRFDALVTLIAEHRLCSCPTRPAQWTPTSPDDTDGTDELSDRGPDAAGRAPCGGRGSQPREGCCAGHGQRTAESDLPIVTVLIPLATALGTSDLPAQQLPSARALTGGTALAGPLSATEARELLRQDVLIRALAVDPVTGRAVGQPGPLHRPHPAPTAGNPPGPPGSPGPPGAPDPTGTYPGASPRDLNETLEQLQTWTRTSPMTRPAPEVPQHRVPAGMRREVIARCGTCEFPDCLVHAERCDLDHDIPWPLGPTVGTNLGALCRRHHRMKQTGWTKARHPDGSVTWTSPRGRRVIRPSWHPTPHPTAEESSSHSSGARSELASEGVSARDVMPRPTHPWWDSTPEGYDYDDYSDPRLDDPFSGTPPLDPTQLADPLTAPTPDDPHPHGRHNGPCPTAVGGGTGACAADDAHHDTWAWVDDPTLELPHPADARTTADATVLPWSDWTASA